MSTLTFLVSFVYYIVYPLYCIAKFLVSVLIIIATPFAYLAQHIGYVLWYPVHILVRFIAKFETLYIFFGVATLVGILTGAILHYFSAFLVTTLNLKPPPQTPYLERTAATYRAERREKVAVLAPMLTVPPLESRAKVRAIKDEYAELLGRGRGMGRRGLLGTTILEEEDSSDNF